MDEQEINVKSILVKGNKCLSLQEKEKGVFYKVYRLKNFILIGRKI